MALPIATKGCHHECPAYDGDTAHIGGPALAGSPNVFACQNPCCRLGDALQCNSSSPDYINSGSHTVFINGKPVARRGDSNVHGGVLSEGKETILVG